MNSRTKGKVGEREFAALLRGHGFDARRGQQFSGGADSPDVVSAALDWLHIEVKRVQQLNLAEACAQASRDAGGKPWIVAHRRNREPWMVTMDSDALYELLRQTIRFFDLRPFAGPRFVTLDAELFFQFLRVAAPLANGTNETDSTPHPGPLPNRGGEGEKSPGESPALTGGSPVPPTKTIFRRDAEKDPRDAGATTQQN